MAKTIAQIVIAIAIAETRLTSLRTQLEQAKAKDIALIPGQAISFNYGRGETRVVKTGKVVAENTAENGVKFVKVVIGEGFDAEFATVRKVDVLFGDDVAPVAPAVEAQDAAA